MSAYHEERIDTPLGTTTETATARRISPGQVLGGMAGAVLTLFGIVAVVRTGVDANLNEPVTEIFGLTHSAYVGFFEIAVGLLLLASASSVAYRGAMGFLGALAIVAGVVVAAASVRILLEVGVQKSTGWFLVVMGAVALAGAMMPSFVRTERQVTQIPG